MNLTEHRPNVLPRRRFLRDAGLTLGAGGVAMAVRPAVAQAAAGAPGRTVVVVFCRGGYDGLSIVAPVGVPEYAARRPTIAVPAAAALPLRGPAPDSTFAWHPGAQRLAGLYDQGRVAVVNAAGVTVANRSHFDAQSYLESGTTDTKVNSTGWAGRWLAATAAPSDHPLRSLAIGGSLPASLRGSSAVAATGFDSLTLFDWGPTLAEVTAATTDLYLRPGAHPALAQWAAPTLSTLGQMGALGSTDLPASFPNTPLGRNLWPIARLVESGFPVEVAHADMGGWDTHDLMGAATSTSARMYRLVAELDGAIGAFYERLGARGDSVTTVVVSEFGRRVYENSSGGCDHGRGFPMLVIGGGVRGGVHGTWPGLGADQLDDGDLRVTTDHRTVLAEVLARRLGATAGQLGEVFPRFAATNGWLGVTTTA